ncbi:hypothetical protein SO802_008313 [Lithocarpus litseifolius]|uniref:Uncharacterized protein n=1 Tax=Lithocarpus litseifolius TaxID=425828 RepID=A0AAW2DCE5_9ROSI
MSLAIGEGSSCRKGKEVVADKPFAKVEKGEEGPYFELYHSNESEVHRNPNSECLPLIDLWYDTYSHFSVVPGDYSRPLPSCVWLSLERHGFDISWALLASSIPDLTIRRGVVLPVSILFEFGSSIALGWKEWVDKELFDMGFISALQRADVLKAIVSSRCLYHYRDLYNLHHLDWTSPGSDWVLNRGNLPMELRSSLDDLGHPIVKNEENPTEVTFPKVPLTLRKKPRSKDYFDPTVISFGLYHRGKRELQKIDTIKDVAMLKFIKESGKSFPEFYYKVRNMNNDTRACYVDCSKEKYCDDTLALTMLRDGCFISYLLDILVDKKEYEASELFANHGSFLGYSSVISDMVLLENQIPLAVLELLKSLRYNNNKVVPKMIKQFIYFAFWHISLEEVPEDMDEEPQARCLLECIRKEFSKVVDQRKEPKSPFQFCSIIQISFMESICKYLKKGA